MQTTALVTIEIPMSDLVQKRIKQATDTHEKQMAALPEEKRKPFEFLEVYELTLVKHVLQRNAEVAKKKLRRIMKGWEPVAPNEISCNILSDRFQYQQLFSK